MTPPPSTPETVHLRVYKLCTPHVVPWGGGSDSHSVLEPLRSAATACLAGWECALHTAQGLRFSSKLSS